MQSKLTFRVAITRCMGDHVDKVTSTIDRVFVKIDQKNNVKRVPYATQSQCTTICLLTRENSCMAFAQRVQIFPPKLTSTTQ